MPVRLLNSVVLRWPRRDEVLAAARRWAIELTQSDDAVEEVFCVGSCARGDWGVGSDLDVIVIVSSAPDSPVERRRLYEPTNVPVPSDVWIYTRDEWAGLAEHSVHLLRRLQNERVVLNDEFRMKNSE